MRDEATYGIGDIFETASGETAGTMTNWVAGYNMPSYLPEMEPFVTSDWESARAFLLDEMERSQDMAVEISEYDKAADLAVSIGELGTISPGVEWGVISGDLSWWINATDEQPEDES